MLEIIVVWLLMLVEAVIQNMLHLVLMVRTYCACFLGILCAIIYSVEPYGCPMETDNIYGFNWPSTKAGHVAVVNCSVFINITFATRLCNINGVWDDNIDVSNCESDEYSFLSIRVK